MRVTFAGVLCPSESHFEDAIESAEAVQRWQCSVCYSWSECLPSMHQSSATQQQLCRVCTRPRHPPWLHLSKHDLQIQLGSLVQIRQREDAKDSLDVGVVVAIDHAHKQVELVTVSRSPDQRPEARLCFRELVVTHPQQFETLEPLKLNTLSANSDKSPSDSVSDWHEHLSKHGICGACRRVFRASQGDLQSRIANNEVVQSLQARLDTLRALKQQRIREHKFALVLDATAEIRALEQQMQRARRQLEFLEPLFCPFCGWVEPRRHGSSIASPVPTAATTPLTQ